MKMRGYFVLNIKHGASQLYWGPTALSLATRCNTSSSIYCYRRAPVVSPIGAIDALSSSTLLCV